VGNFVDDTHIIHQSEIGAKIGAGTAFTGAMGTWVLNHSEFISLFILFSGFAVGVFFSWRRDKYLQRQDQRQQIEHELTLNNRRKEGLENDNGYVQ
jgi:hypothetical protein